MWWAPSLEKLRFGQCRSREEARARRALPLPPSEKHDKGYVSRMNYTGSRPLVESGETASDALWVTYRWMTLGLACTGVVALAVAHSPAALELLLGNRLLFYALLFGQLGLVFAFSAVAMRVSTPVAATMFFAYAALTGVTFSTLFLFYAASSIAATFFVTAGAFAGLSVVGFVTKRDLSVVGRFAIFALIHGVLIATVVNMLLRSSGSLIGSSPSSGCCSLPGSRPTTPSA